MGRTAGRSAGLGATVPQTERQAHAAGRRRALEVMNEPGRGPRLRVRPIVVGREGGLVGTGQAGERNATMYHSPGGMLAATSVQLNASPTGSDA